MSNALREVLTLESLVSHFQPIVSVKKKRIVGAEALARATVAGAPISPLKLFQWADQDGQMLELERLCRKRAMEGFSEIIKTNPELLLFFNFEVSVLDDGVFDSDLLVSLAADMGLKPENIVIEINESRVEKLPLLQRFVEIHKDFGFLIALDDLGAGHSNLQRLSLLKPDILKLDRSLIQDLTGDFFKQEIFKSLVSLARNIGALVLAEGVETESEVSTCLGLGTDLFQGFYFSKAVEAAEWGPGEVTEVIEICAANNRESVVRDMLNRRDASVKYRALLMDLIGRLSGNPAENFEHILSETFLESRDVECLYVINNSGIQLTPTVTMQFTLGRKRGPLFQPSLAGEDHSMKDYFYSLMDAGLTRFITEPYISLVSGNLCRTLSSTFKGNNDKNYILCVDVKAD